jgi:hypothetical protein
MNLLEVTIIKNITKIHKIDDKSYSKTVIIDCYGVTDQRIITGDWNYVRKHKIGYKWLE